MTDERDERIAALEVEVASLRAEVEALTTLRKFSEDMSVAYMSESAALRTRLSRLEAAAREFHAATYALNEATSFGPNVSAECARVNDAERALVKALGEKP
jgi:hypothetical protein